MTDSIAIELETFEHMLDIYCSRAHASPALCGDCDALLLYAAGRLAKCPHHPKPACKKCPTHCFSPEMREKIRAVMRHAGPRMPLRHPILTLRYYLR